ncbi:MAG: DUF362 domain-containing protein [archaeon]|nr:DUF362 domain-containing protein [archaeon]MCP8316124.1 DUF362 domain-containing protein [archaeon]
MADLADARLEDSKSHRLSNKVAIVRGERSIETVMKALDLIGGVNEFFDKPILIKVNLIASKTWDKGVTTDPIVVEALIKAFKEVNDDIFVIESDATFTNADKAAKISGILDVCEKYSVPFVNLRHLNERLTIKPEEPETLLKITLPKFILDGYIISAAKMKTHVDTQVTLGMKNMFGLIPPYNRFKFKYHFTHSIDKVIVDVNTIIKSVLTVIDGFIAMEGQGPIDGKPIKMNLIIAGKDVVATDAVASRVMGFDPRLIYHIRRASEKGLGAMEGYEVVGESVESVARRFRRP